MMFMKNLLQLLVASSVVTSVDANGVQRSMLRRQLVAGGCETCTNVDFTTYPNGTAVQRGDYISEDWFSLYGITITAAGSSGSGAFTPLGRARVFDTSNPGTNNNNGDPDLGSPNNKCSGGGPGFGVGGEPGETGENCVPQGNVIIIQESDKIDPDDEASGGEITVEFASPVNFKEIGLMDMDANGLNEIDVYESDGTFRTISYAGAGDNGVQMESIDASVDKLVVKFRNSGAITDLKFCIPHTCAPSSAPSLSAGPTSSAAPSVFPSESPSKAPAAPSLSPIAPAPPACRKIDFSTYPDGSAVNRGDYVSDDWSSYGVTIEALPNNANTAHTPIKAGTTLQEARVFDTSNPGTNNDNGDPDLGSPNNQCSGGGPGKGTGGQPGKQGENCDASKVGNVLIIQEGDKTAPDDDYRGGDIVFTFSSAIEFERVGLMDMDDGNPNKIEVHLADGTQVDYSYTGYGNNSVQWVDIMRSNVIMVVVVFRGSGAVMDIEYCVPPPEVA